MPYIKARARVGLWRDGHALGKDHRLLFKLLKFLVYVLVIAAAGVVGYAYLGDLSPEVETVTQPVSFDAR